MPVLDPKVHGRLIEEIDEVARAAGIQRRYIEESMTEHCGPEEVAWVKGYRDHVATGQYGLCYQSEDHTLRMMAMAGAFTRNFVLARVATMTEVVDEMRVGEAPSASVLLIPSFHRPMQKGGVTAFQVNLLWQLLEGRMLAGKQTVIGVQSIAQMGQDYGPHFRQLVENHYEIVS